MLRSYHSYIESYARIYRLLYTEKGASSESIDAWLGSSVGKRTNLRMSLDSTSLQHHTHAQREREREMYLVMLFNLLLLTG
jgi:hypothetical protein